MTGHVPMSGRAIGLVRSFGALIVTVGLVVGIPALLVALVGNPFPSEVPSVDEIQILLTQNGQGFTNFLMSTLAVVIWFVWAQLVAALVAEVFATARRTQTPQLPTAPGIQALAARLVASITLAVTLAAGPMMAPAVGALNLDVIAPISTPTQSTAMASLGLAGHGVVDQGVVGPGATNEFHALSQNTAGHDDQGSAATILAVAEHTELWDLAEAAYGDGLDWKRIAQANVGRTDATGSAITEKTESVASGTVLRLPGQVRMPEVEAFGTVTAATEVSVSNTPDVQQVEQPADAPSQEIEAPPGKNRLSKVTTDSGNENGHQDHSQLTGASDLPTPVIDLRSHAVEPGESMWAIAQAEVEQMDGMPDQPEVGSYWAQVVELNPDVRSGDPDLIYPGEQINLPPKQVGADEPDDDAAIASDADDSERAAEGSVGSQDQPSGERAKNVKLKSGASAQVHGQLDDTWAGLESQGRAAVADASARGVVSAAPSAENHSAETDLGAQEGQPVSRSAVGLAAFGSAMLSAGIVGALRRRRALQRRVRHQGHIAPPPSTDAAAFEAALIHASDQIVESQTGAGWRMLPAETVDAMRQAGPLTLHAKPDGTVRAINIVTSEESRAQVTARQVNLAEPKVAAVADPAGSAQSVSSSSSAALPDHESDLAAVETTAGIADGTAEIAATVPSTEHAQVATTLVVGTDRATGEAVVVDLQSTVQLAIEGEQVAISRFARSAVLDLAVSGRADDLCVIAVGMCAELNELERVHIVASFAEAHQAAVRCGHAVPDSATSVVVVSAVAPERPEDIAALLELGVVLVGPGLHSTSRVVIDGDFATIEPVGTAVVLAALQEDGFWAVVELVENSRPEASQEAPQPLSVAEVLDVQPDDFCAVDAGPVEVRVLGSVEVAGAGSFSSLKAIDVVTYLAFHRNGVDADQIKSWVWPAFNPPTDKAFANVLSRARTGLGTNDEGEPYLSRAGADKIYRLAEQVTTDFDRFRAIVSLADQADEQAAELRLLKQALSLIRGVPFTGGGASNFAWADNHVRANVEYTIDEAVHRCADLALELGDLSTARWAALKGHELVPGCEQCFRRRFLIASAGKNRSELRRAMADLEASAAVDLGEPEAIDTISGELLALYHELDQSLVAGSA